MTKADIIHEITMSTGIEKTQVEKTIEAYMEQMKTTMIKGNNVYLRGFGSFVVKKRAEKTARNISKNTTVIIPAHFVPTFKPASEFIEEVSVNVFDDNNGNIKSKLM